ncbi:MAG TPA: DEAD/DEAH box helicase [Candidatus Corynebacterium gallistercoris]|uniref:DEAD/DEAH box helicase n=1 Tax=Candidatus Corynebacterium gallistercoris TaxID=2838530 RepID=A0A9D1S0L5_9CORY|nr:DEAD/DEAH box helicase [Candidatus Corynebacterium gallistercoris]
MSNPATQLPFASAKQQLHEALRTHGVAVIQAPPGTGKTTLAPGYVAELQELEGQRVVVTQPRRVAARAAAERHNQLVGAAASEAPETPAAFTVRGESTLTRDTRIEFVTPGVLLRRLLNDPDLPGIGAVILDEIHERSLDTDLAFAMLAQLRELREDLMVIAMSATVDARRFAAALTPNAPGTSTTPPTVNTANTTAAPIVAVDSPIHPLTIHHATSHTTITRRDRSARPGQPGSIEDHVTRAIATALEETNGDILAFVPTIRATELITETLNRTHPHVTAQALHGRLTPQEQGAIVGAGWRRTQKRRVIVATNVAESSLTVPGVRVVVDACLARVSRRDSTRGMNVLVTELCSQASAVQRAGRAGREGPGVVYRCITPEEFGKLPEFAAPEIATSDLTGALLDCAVWGAPGGEGLALPDPFPVAAAKAGQAQLEMLGLVDDTGVTELGHAAARLPMSPHLARGGLLAVRRVAVEQVTAVLHALEEEAPVSAGVAGSGSHPTARRFAKALRRHADAPDLRGAEAVAYTVACAFPHMIGRVDGSRALLTSSTAASFLGATPPPPPHSWIAVGSVTRARTGDGTGAVIRSYVPISFELACEAYAGGVTRQRSVVWDASAGKARAREVSALGAVELETRPVEVTEDEAAAALAAYVEAEGVGSMVKLSPGAESLVRRVQFLAAAGVEGFPELVAEGGGGAGAGAGGLVLPHEVLAFIYPEVLAGRAPDVESLLKGVLPWDKPVDELAPERVELPTGRKARVTYPELSSYPNPGPPIVATKLQDCFGLQESPVIAGQRVQFHLLSPAGRPLAVTDDLASFWAGPYQGVRKDMRGRYPKHSWPEDPAALTP